MVIGRLSYIMMKGISQTIKITLLLKTNIYSLCHFVMIVHHNIHNFHQGKSTRSICTKREPIIPFPSHTTRHNVDKKSGHRILPKTLGKKLCHERSFPALVN